MKTMLLIVNPCSGQKKAKKHLADILDIFNRAGFAVFTHITAGHADAEAAVLRYADQIDRVVCCGGDGTFNETVSGVLKSGRDLPIGYIPAGSTNDFATSLGLHSDLLQAAQDIVDGTPVRLDVGCLGDRYFSYVASFGIFTRTTYTTPQSAKNAIGHAAYILSGIQELSQIRAYPVQMTLSDGSVLEEEYIFGAISNTTSLGGVLTLDSDKVNMSDGLFEVLLIRKPKDLFELSDCVRALQQKTYQCQMLTFASAREVAISAPEDMAWTLDGEAGGCHPHTLVRCLHQAIQVYQNRKEKHLP